MTNTKVAICPSSGELSRYVTCWDSIMGLKRPQDTIWDGPDHFIGRGASIAVNRNGSAERALAVDCTHVLYLDDDHIFPPHLLTQLLSHDKDIISGLYVSREAPFYPQIYKGEDDKRWVHNKLLDPFMSGVIEVDCVGAGCLLVKAEVFRGMEKPWWTLGQTIKDGWGDDVDFCRRARDAGFRVWCDLELPVGHICNMTVWPQRGESGDWTTVLIGANSLPLIQFPAARHKKSLVSL